MKTDIIYSDIMFDFDIHPIKKDVIRAVNESAVKQSIRNLVMCSRGERFFQPYIGGNIKQFLFEPISNLTAADIRSNIEQTLANYEPRAREVNVTVTPNFFNDSYNITVSFYIQNVNTPSTLTITLNRLR